MATYQYPEMPLLAHVWFDATPQDLLGLPDEAMNVSLSPVRPEDFFRGRANQASGGATHIIRCAPDSRLGDNMLPELPVQVFPTTVFEVPAASGHFYAAVWSHQVGAGFPNWHARVYCQRFTDKGTPPPPLFQGWI